MKSSIAFIIIALSLIPTVDAAEKRIRIVGRPEVVVTKPAILISDFADVSSIDSEDDEAVLAIRRIQVSQSPAPGETLSIEASRILERLEESGVELRDIGYSIPRTVRISRAFREVTRDEIKAAIEEFLRISGKDASIRGIEYDKPKKITPGTITLEARPSNQTEGGRSTFEIIARGEGDSSKFNIAAYMDEWRDFPIASRPIQKGSIISDTDVSMARLNLSSMPKDAALDTSRIIGFEASRDVGQGEVFRLNKLSLPAVISAGNKVALVYTSKFFKATATGIAMDAGAVGDEIRVRNESSKKIISGKVIEPGIVGVTQ